MIPFIEQQATLVSFYNGKTHPDSAKKPLKISSCARRLDMSLVRKAERSTSRAGCSYFIDDRDDPIAIATSTSPLLDRSLSL